MLHTKKEKALFTLALAGGYTVLFLLHYLFSVLNTSDFLIEIVSYIVYILVSALLAFTACLFHQSKESGPRSYAQFLLLLSTRLFYQIPYYLIYYLSSGYTIGEAALLGCCMGLLDLVIWYVVFVIFSFLLSRFGWKGEKGAVWLCLCAPAYEFVLVIIELILYVKQYNGMIFTDDIPYFVFGFLYPALMFATAYLTTLFLPKVFKSTSQKGE